MKLVRGIGSILTLGLIGLLIWAVQIPTPSSRRVVAASINYGIPWQPFSTRPHAQGIVDCTANTSRITTEGLIRPLWQGVTAGEVLAGFSLVNTSEHPCATGIPVALLRVLDANGNRLPVAHAPWGAPVLSATVYPGQQAVASVLWEDQCAFRPSKSITLVLRVGGFQTLQRVHLPGVRFANIGCGSSSKGGVMRLSGFGNVSWPRTLRIRLENVPASFESGGVLRYTVSLMNASARPIRLAACPRYTESLDAPGQAITTTGGSLPPADISKTYLLNCDSLEGVLVPGRWVPFEMHMPVPSNFLSETGACGYSDSFERCSLSWQLDPDGASVERSLRIATPTYLRLRNAGSSASSSSTGSRFCSETLPSPPVCNGPLGS